ncbi:hypothetical protein [Gemmatirosa kalamazoonensis]|nr:hypothetical protein [Gemmatirosa kalamazoonensis]
MASGWRRAASSASIGEKIASWFSDSPSGASAPDARRRTPRT